MDRLYSAEAAHTSPHTSQLPALQAVAPPTGPLTDTASASAVSWGAIFAGAAGAAALSLILLMLGVGLGLSTVSPWAREGIGASGLGASTIAWIIFTQLLASALGGYLAGRLRTRWVATHGDEVYFRDTAHGFLAWAVASLVTATLLASAATAIVGGGVQASAQLVGGAATASTQIAAKAGADDAPMGYLVDTLFRSEAPGAAPTPSALPALEVSRIFVANLPAANLPPSDLRHIGLLVSQHTGLAQADADKRVAEVYTRLQTQLQSAKAAATEAVDKARKASAYAVLWLFIALLMGAFVASWVATYGGRQRDL